MRLTEFNAAMNDIAEAVDEAFFVTLTLTTGQTITGGVGHAQQKTPEGKFQGECVWVAQRNAPVIFVSLQHVICLRIAD